MVAAVALMALVSCNKEEFGNNTNEVVFTAEFEQDASTKTTLGTDRKAHWEVDDQIKINGTVFTANEVGPESSFTTTENFDVTATPFRAVYPASSYISTTAVDIPAAQNGSFASASIAVAETSDHSLVFQNLSSILKFRVPVNCSKVTIESTASLAGRITVNYTDGVMAPNYASVTQPSKTITVNGTFVPGTDYYVAVKPGSQKFTVSIDGRLSKASDKSVTVERTHIYNLGVLPKAKLARDLAYDKETVNHTLGNAFTAPKLTGITDGVTYNSTNSAVATIDATGNVTIVGAEGTTRITASAPETENYFAEEATYTLTVTKQDRGLQYSEEKYIYNIDEEFTAPELTGITDGVTYESSDPAVATIDATTGKVSVIATGETTITASAEETDIYKAQTVRYTLIVEKYFNVYVCIDDLKWTSVNMHQFTSAGDLTEWPGEALTETVTVNGKKYYKKSIKEDTTLSFTYNNGKASTNFKIDVGEVTVNSEIYYRLSARGAIEVDPNDVKTFGYAIYVFDQKSKNVAPNLYAWNDGDKWKTKYGDNFSTWPGVAFPNDCYYVPADGNNWKHYYYFEIPTDLYNTKFNYIVNKKGQTADQTSNSVTGDIYVGYWYDNPNSNGFWVDSDKTIPITK